MADWISLTNGEWTDSARWSGGVPNGAGAVANFVNNTDTRNLTALIGIGSAAAPNQSITIGTLNLTTIPNFAWAITGGINGVAPTLIMAGAGGGPAAINVDSNGSTNNPRITNAGGLRMSLSTDTIITTLNSDTSFLISAPIFGAGELQKFGTGTLILQGANTYSSLRINSGTVDLSNTAGAGVGPVVMRGGMLRFSQTGVSTFANDFETTSNASTFAKILVATGTTVTMTGGFSARGGTNSLVTLGDTPNAGTLILAASDISVTQSTTFFLAGGTVRFGDALNAAQFFTGGTRGLVNLNSGATLDTGGFATTLTNLDANGGNIVSTGGALDLTVNFQGRSALNFSGVVTGTSGADRIVLTGFILDLGGGASQRGNFLDFSGWSIASWNNAADTITINGHSAGETIVGTSQNDTINGNGGDDSIDGGGGSNRLLGGTGNDTYLIDTTTDAIIELAGEGTDEVRIVATSSVTSFTLGANLENLTFLGTAANQVGVGNGADNVITAAGTHATLAGLDGNDRLIALNVSGQAHELIGGRGDDTYVIAERASSVIEFANEGIDAVETTSAIYVLGNNLENLTFTNAIAHAGVGNELANFIIGSTASDELYGREGNDTLDGGSGAANALFGQQGDDRYFIRVAGDSIIEFANEGRDQVTLDSTVSSFTLPANVEDLTSIGGAKTIVGNALDNQLSGNSGADQIVGMDGNDIIIGLNGADLLQGGNGADQFLYRGGETGFDRILDFVSGTDKIALSAAFFTPTANVAFVTGAGAVANSANSTFLYDTSTGIVSYDDDGNGAGAAVQLAQLNLGQTVVAGDFIFV
jgi:Ca2+-binding RTX toxin-like protein